MLAKLFGLRRERSNNAEITDPVEPDSLARQRKDILALQKDVIGLYDTIEDTIKPLLQKYRMRMHREDKQKDAAPSPKRKNLLGGSRGRTEKSQSESIETQS